MSFTASISSLPVEDKLAFDASLAIRDLEKSIKSLRSRVEKVDASYTMLAGRYCDYVNQANIRDKEIRASFDGVSAMGKQVRSSLDNSTNAVNSLISTVMEAMIEIREMAKALKPKDRGIEEKRAIRSFIRRKTNVAISRRRWSQYPRNVRE